MRHSLINILFFLFVGFGLIRSEDLEIVKISDVRTRSVELELNEEFEQFNKLFVVLRKVEDTLVKPRINQEYLSIDNIESPDSISITGIGNYVVYNGKSSNRYTLEGLVPDTFYRLDLYLKEKSAYSLIDTSFTFTTMALSPEKQTQKIMWSNQTHNSMIVYAAGGSGERALIAVSKSINDFVPSDGADYIADSSFGSGIEVVPGVFIVSAEFDSSKSARISNLEPGTDYYITAFEFNGKNKSKSFSKELVPMKNAVKIPTLIQAPGLFKLEKSGDRAFTAEWTQVKGAVSYELEVAFDINFETIDDIYGKLDLGNLNTFTLDELPASTKYFVRVRALGKSSGSGYSNVLSIKL